MIKVHHLNNSRSQRVLWMLEELGLPYEIVPYQRDPTTRLAPESLKKIHPLGKSPVIEDDGLIVAESGAIIEFLARKYGQGKLTPKADTPAYVRYLHWMHYSEGSAMLPLMLALYVGRLGEAGAPLLPRIASEMGNHFGYMNIELAKNEYFAGPELTAADIQMSFPIEALGARNQLGAFPNLAKFLARIQARPAYQRALQRGGPYELGR